MLEISGQIMSADIPVVEIENGIVKSVNKELAPLFFLRSLDFTAWLESRAIDSHRTNSRLLKKALRLSNKDDANTVLAVNAVTITDNYWFKESGSDLTWENVRFKENFFDNLALCGDFESFNQPVSRTPELTNIGSFEKCWRLIDNKWWLYKTGNQLEYFSELFIAKLAEKLGFPMAKYELYDNYVRTLDFTNGNQFNFEVAESLVGDNEFYDVNFEKFYSISKDVAADYLRMIYLDTLCSNVDRHTKNYGVLRDVNSGKIISLAPNYDNNIALIARGYPKSTNRENDKLIDFFLDLLRDVPKASELFNELEIPVVTADMLNECIDEVGIDVEKDIIIDYILNGQQIISEFFDQFLSEDPTLSM